MPIRFIVILTLAGIFLSGGRLFGDDEEYLVDPNGESAPQAIQDLELTFRLNSYDINAPTILFTADGSLGFVNYIKSESQAGQGYVLVFKPAEVDPAQRIVTAIPVGQYPALMYLNPAQTEIWVVNLGNFGSTFNTSGTISVIQIASQSVIATIAAPEARFGLGSNVLFSTDGGVAYISSTYTDEILRLDTSSYQIVDKLKLPAEFPYYYASVAPSCLTLSHDGTFICSTNTFNETISIISTSSFTELRRVILRDAPYDPTRHYANLTFRNNVLLSEDGTLGLVGSAGLTSASFDPGVVFIPDRVYLFDPQTGVKIKNDDGQDIFLPVEDNPTTLTLDPTGRYLVVAIASYDKVDSTGAEFYGYPAIHMFTWPELQLFKIQQFRSPEYNLTRTGAFGFTPDGAGNYDPVFPSFSTFSTFDSDVPNEKLVRVSGSYLDSTTGLGTLGDGENRYMPVTLSPVPGSSNFAVAYFLMGTVAIVPPPEVPNFSDAFSVFIEDDRFSSILMLNPWNESVNYFVQAIQTNNTNDDNEDDDWAGLPFFWLDENNNAYVIDPYEIVLEPGQQLVSMFQGLVPGYDKVENQHGFLKAGHPERPIVGLTYNGHYSDEGVLTRGDYLQAGHEMYQDAIFPYLFSVGNNVTVLHYTNPYFNQMRVQRLIYNPDGTAFTGGSATFYLGATTGIDQVFVDVPINGYLRVFNLDNLRTNVYQTQECSKEVDNFFFSCPPLNPYRATRLQHMYVPYYAVGGTFDTSIVLISTNARTDPDVLDEDGDPVTLTTHLRMDFYDAAGTYQFTKEADFNNTARYEIFLSSDDLLGIGRFDAEIHTGSIVLTVDRDNVCGVYAYTMWNEYEETEDPIPPLTNIRNMTVDVLPLTEDASQTVLFPYTISIEPFHTSYVLYNPGDQPITARLDLYDPEGALVGSSIEDIPIPAHGQFIFFMGDPDIFGEVPGLDHFVGYMRAQSTSGSRLFGKSIQSSPEMLAIIPTL